MHTAHTEKAPKGIGNEGERFVPGTLSPENAFEHLHRYALAAELSRDLRVLDLASGEGYGAARLAETAATVFAVELDPSAVARASQTYARSNLRFMQGSITNLLATPELAGLAGTFDVVTCFEAIEHVQEHDALLAGVKKMLAPGGVFLISTPDKEQYTDIPNNHNPFHVRELYRQEFIDLLSSQFQHVKLYGQRVLVGSHLWVEKPDTHTGNSGSAGSASSTAHDQGEYAVRQEPNGAFNSVSLKQRKPLYYVAACSAQPLPTLPNTSSLMNLADWPDQASSKHIAYLTQELAHTQRALAQEQERFVQYQRETERGVAALNQQIKELTKG